MSVKRAIDCLVNVDLGDKKPPKWMVRVKEDYFKGGESFLASPELPALIDDMDAHGVERAILLSNLEVERDRGQRYATERPDRFALGVGGLNLLRPVKSLRKLEAFVKDHPVAYVDRRPELLGRRHVPTERRRLLPALRQVLRARPSAVLEHRNPRAAAACRRPEPDPPRPRVHPVPGIEALHDARRRPVVGHSRSA